MCVCRWVGIFPSTSPKYFSLYTYMYVPSSAIIQVLHYFPYMHTYTLILTPCTYVHTFYIHYSCPLTELSVPCLLCFTFQTSLSINETECTTILASNYDRTFGLMLLSNKELKNSTVHPFNNQSQARGFLTASVRTYVQKIHQIRELSCLYGYYPQQTCVYNKSFSIYSHKIEVFTIIPTTLM